MGGVTASPLKSLARKLLEWTRPEVSLGLYGPPKISLQASESRDLSPTWRGLVDPRLDLVVAVIRARRLLFSRSSFAQWLVDSLRLLERQKSLFSEFQVRKIQSSGFVVLD